MNTISDDILLLLAQALDIDTFFNFRLVCRKYYDLTYSHMRGLAPEIARSTLPRLSEILNDEGFRRSPTPLESIRWLKRLRYEYLAAVMFEHAAPHRMAQINADLTAQRFDPLIVVASGWHVLARLSKLTREADMRFQSRYNEPSRMVDLECEQRTWNLNLCRQWLDMIGTLKVSELYGFKWLLRCLVQDVFGFKGKSAKYSDKYLSDLDCVAWLTTWIFRVGPGPFWLQWTGENALISQRSLETSIEAAWQRQRTPLENWELDNVRNVERQVLVILRLASEGFDGYDFDDPACLNETKTLRMRCLTRLSGPDHLTYWVKSLQLEPISGAARRFPLVTFEAYVDWPRLGYEPPTPPPEREASYSPSLWSRTLGFRYQRLFQRWRRVWPPALRGEYKVRQKRLKRLYIRTWHD